MIVQILGVAPSLAATPSVPLGERWCMNHHRMYRVRGLPAALTTWTRWFNLHSHRHMLATYPGGYKWYQNQDGTRPIYLQEADPEIPGSKKFPREEIQSHFGGETFFTCSTTWLMAFAILEGFKKIELWGHAEVDKNGMSYWIGRARQAGIEVWIQPGSGLCVTPKLYGYETT